MQQPTRWRWYLLPLLWIIAGTARPVTYSAGIENSQWYLTASIFECRLTHDIPNFGEAVFYRRAGEGLHFALEPTMNPMRPGKAALVIEAPAWRPGASVRDLGYVKVTDGRQAVDLGGAEAALMMASLEQGMMPTVTRKAWYANEPVRVRVSAINFARRIGEYKSCVTGLLPVNFQQVEDTTVYFGDNGSSLSDAQKAKLDRVILYVRADPSVTNIYVDGHTDASGSRISNRLLSKARAEAVTQYLSAHGIDGDRITTRFHGERYQKRGVSPARQPARHRPSRTEQPGHAATSNRRLRRRSAPAQADPCAHRSGWTRPALPYNSAFSANPNCSGCRRVTSGLPQRSIRMTGAGACPISTRWFWLTQGAWIPRSSSNGCRKPTSVKS